MTFLFNTQSLRVLIPCVCMSSSTRNSEKIQMLLQKWHFGGYLTQSLNYSLFFFVLNSILQLSKRYMDWNLYYWRIFGLCPFPPYSANHYLIMSLLWWWGCCCCCGIFKIVFPMIDRKFQKYHTVFTLKTFITLNACVTWVACIFIGILSHTFNCHGYA